jgi:hypothetical protein
MYNDYTLLWRTYPNGTMMVFCYAYDGNDVRQGPWTTKCRSITAAQNYCNRLIKTDRLISGAKAFAFWYKRKRKEPISRI